MNSAAALFTHADPQSPITWQNGRPISVERFAVDAASLAQRLPRAGFQINLCQDRHHFLLGLAAALQRGQILLLPPSRAADELERLSRDHPDAYCLCDHAVDGSGLHILRIDQLLPLADGRGAGSPEVAAQQPVAELSTSGSTGGPSIHRKHWQTLQQGATLTGRRLGLERLPGASLLATVPPQHMYGLETSVMLPLRWGLAVASEQPLLGSEIAVALQRLPTPRILVTTPLHLRSCLGQGTALPDLAFILSATAPLPRRLAQQAEQTYGTRVMEIYGSTETGAVATRRPAVENDWLPLPGIRIESHADHCCIGGGHLPQPMRVSDHIEMRPDGRFRLIGRDADLVKIAGKRASLTDLQRRLLEIEGVSDGVFIQPEDAAAGISRLACVAVAPDLDEAAILERLRPKLDPVFMPRPLLRVDALPRNAAGKLPRHRLLQLLQQQE